MGFLSDLFSGGASALVNSVGNVLDNVITTKEEKLQLELEMKKADMQYQLDTRKLDVAERQQNFDDIAGARTMAATVQTSEHASWMAKNTSPLLALGTTFLTFGLFGALVFFNKALIANETKDIVLYILGVLSAIVTQIFSFYFGSSLGSSMKNKTISELQTKVGAQS